MTFRLPEGHWIIITIFIVSQANAGASVSKAVQRLIATIAGATAGILLIIAFPQEPWFRVPLFALICGFGLFLSRTTTAPYVGLLAVITLALVFGGVVDDPAQQIPVGLWRMLLIGVGVTIGTAVQLLLWPQDPEAALLADFKAILEDAGALLRRLRGAEAHGDPVTGRLEQLALNGLARHLDLLAHAEALYPRLRRRRTEQLALITAFNRLATALVNLRGVIGPPQGAGSNAALLPFRGELDHLVRSVQVIERALASQRPPDPAALTPMPMPPAAADEAADPVRALVRPTLVEIDRALSLMPPALAFLDTSAEAATLPSAMRSPLDNPDTDRFLTPRFSLANTDDLRFAAKGTLATMICYVLINGLNWADGFTAVITCAIVAQGSVGATLQKAGLRLIGALLGGLAALTVISGAIPNMTTLPALLVISSVFFALAGYVTAGSARISYAGVQIGMAFAVGVLDTTGPTVNLFPPVNRVLGIVLGNVVTAAVFSFVAPVFAGEQMVRSVAAALRHIAALLRLGLHDERAAVVVHPARGFRMQIFQDFANTMQLGAEAEFERHVGRTGLQAQRDAILAMLHEAQTVFLLVIAAVRHRLNLSFLEANPSLRRAVREVALGIDAHLEAIAARLDGQGGPRGPALDALLLEAEARARATEGLTALPAEREASTRLRDQLEYYRQVIPHIAQLQALARTAQRVTRGNAAARAGAFGPQVA